MKLLKTCRSDIRRYRGRPEDEMYGFGQLLAYGTQHILTMYGGVIAPPLIVGGAAGLCRRATWRCWSPPGCS